MWSWLLIAPAVLIVPISRRRALKIWSTETGSQDAAEVVANSLDKPVFPDDLKAMWDQQNR